MSYPSPAISAAKLAANRANAQLSCGPTTEAGKAKVSLNAVKTGLTGQTVLLPTDDAAAYEALIARTNTTWQPATDGEKALVQSIADTDWRLARIPSLESGIYAVGQLRFANEYPQIADEQVRRTLIQARVHLAFEKQLKNLSLQESRLRRHRAKDEAHLRELQDARLGPQRRLDAAANAYIVASFDKRQPFDPAKFGFEFSFPQIIRRAYELRPEIDTRPAAQTAAPQSTAA